VRQHLADPPPVAMPPVVGQPLLVIGPFREIRVREEQLRRPETAILPTVSVSWVLPPLAKLLDRLLLAHPSSLSPYCPCVGQCVSYTSHRSASLKKRESSAPLRPQRHYGIKRPILGASTEWPILGHRLRAENFEERRWSEGRGCYFLLSASRSILFSGCRRPLARRGSAGRGSTTLWCMSHLTRWKSLLLAWSPSRRGAREPRARLLGLTLQLKGATLPRPEGRSFPRRPSRGPLQ
jgi:hypothetical protein